VTVIDVQGDLVVPGFVDSHVHIIGTNFNELFESLNNSNLFKVAVGRKVPHPAFQRAKSPNLSKRV